jgi:hypothetical protein
MVELTVALEERLEQAYRWKREKYQNHNLVADCQQRD